MKVLDGGSQNLISIRRVGARLAVSMVRSNGFDRTLGKPKPVDWDTEASVRAELRMVFDGCVARCGSRARPMLTSTWKT